MWTHWTPLYTAALLGFLSQTHCPAQNLVRNPGFEHYFNYTDNNFNLVFHPEHWYYNPTSTNHPIYFCADRFKNRKMPWNPHPDSSKILAGDNLNYISILILPSTQKAYTKFVSPLSAGKRYRLSIDIRAMDQSNYLSDLLVGLKEKNRNLDSCLYNLQLVLPDSICNEAIYERWITLETEFIAQGKEEELVIAGGSPTDYNKIISSDPEKYQLRRYQGPARLKYYVDNIDLSPMEDSLPVQSINKPDILKSGKSLILDNIYFDFDKYELLPASFPELDSLAGYLLLNPDLHLRISGHTDNFGSDAYNEVLSLKRAESVAEYLTNKGIGKDKLSAVGFGDKLPVGSNDTEEGRRKNRRIEIQMID
jgi:outer membrane protein OmpA-like peptidoglycan-associated protein